MTLSKNIRYLRKSKGWSQEYIADKLGYKSYTTIQKWEMGTSEPPLRKLKELSDLFGVDMDDLTNKDIEYIKNNPKSSTNDIYTYDNIYPIELKKFPLLGEIACGEPIFCNEDRESYILSGTNIKADFCLKAHGDSMINARIYDGDIVFIKEQPLVNDGEIAAVIIENEATLKRVYFDRDNSTLQLVAENPAYRPMVYVGESLNCIRILGKAVAFQSDVK